MKSSPFLPYMYSSIDLCNCRQVTQSLKNSEFLFCIVFLKLNWRKNIEKAVQVKYYYGISASTYTNNSQNQASEVFYNKKVSLKFLQKPQKNTCATSIYLFKKRVTAVWTLKINVLMIFKFVAKHFIS